MVTVREGEEAPENFQAEWARKKFKELCLKTAEKEMFNIELIDSVGIRKEVEEILDV